jgi:hypothetical protein
MKPFLVEIKIYRYPKDQMVAIKNSNGKRYYYQRKGNTLVLLNPQEMLKYLPERISHDKLYDFIE